MSSIRPLTALVTAAGLLAGTIVGTGAEASSPAEGTLDEANDSVTWEGGPFLVPRPTAGDLGCLSPTDPICDHFALELALGGGADYSVEIEMLVEGGDLDLYVFDPAGVLIATSESSDPVENVTLADPPDGTYTVSVNPFFVAPGSGTYTTTATVAEDQDGDEHESFRIDSLVEDCSQLVPRHVGLPGVTDDGSEITLDVVVAYDQIELLETSRGLDLESAKAAALDHLADDVVPAVKTSYAELGIDFNVVGYEEVPGIISAELTDEVRDFNGGTRPAIYSDEMFEQVKDHFEESVPDGIDIVYVATGKDLFSRPDVSGDGQGLLGQANCIGGVRWDDLSFAIGEAWTDRVTGIVAQHNTAALVMSHEVGHLMGAHHHYGECITGQRPHDSNERIDPEHPCTVMFPSAGPNNMPFSMLNGSVVREHANLFARP